MDHDAAPTSLWEVADFQALAEELGVAMPPICHLFSEHVSLINAGLSIFPAPPSEVRPALEVASTVDFKKRRRTALFELTRLRFELRL
jgi:hypothetical protein